jgi:hypothetical protein
MTNLRRILTGFTLAIAASGLASASSVIGYTSVFPASGLQNTDFNYTLTLPKFNLAGENLTGVTIYFYTFESVNDLDVQNASSSAETNFSVSFNTSVAGGTNPNPMMNSAVSADVYGTETLVNFNTGFISLGAGAGTGATPACPGAASTSCSDVFYAPPALTDSNIIEAGLGNIGGSVGTGVSGVAGIVKTDNVNLGSYSGGGTWTLTGKTFSNTGFGGGGGNITLNQTTQAMVEAEVDYTYTTPSGTPEPTTMVLFGSALVGLGLLRKRVRG